jgi:hypothetical protein
MQPRNAEEHTIECPPEAAQLNPQIHPERKSRRHRWSF